MEKLLELFGLDKDFTKEELEQAYRDLVQVWHPDRYSYNPRLRKKTEEKLKEINNAYQILLTALAESRTVSAEGTSPAHIGGKAYNKHKERRPVIENTIHTNRSTFVSLLSVFHPTDFSKASEVAFCHALKLSVITGAKLSILHVTQNREDVRFLEFPEVRHTLERWRVLPKGSSREDVIEKAGILVEKIIKVEEDTVSSILHFLQQNPTDLIVLATHRSREPIGWLKRSVAIPIAIGSGEMTLFIPEGIEGFVSYRDGGVSLRRVLVPIDSHPNPQLAVNAASAIASAFGSRNCLFFLIYIGEPEHMPVVNTPKREGWRWERIVRQGDVVKGILNLERECSADLIVMTTHGHEGFLDALRGSTTERVLRGAGCPLLVIPALRR